MSALLIAAILGTCAPLDLRKPGGFEGAASAAPFEVQWAPTPGPLRYGLAVGDDELGGSVLQADIGYAADRLSMAAALDYRISNGANWPNAGSLAVSISRRLGRRDQLDLYLVRGLNRAGGGVAAGFTLSRALR